MLYSSGNKSMTPWVVSTMYNVQYYNFQLCMLEEAVPHLTPTNYNPALNFV